MHIALPPLIEPTAAKSDYTKYVLTYSTMHINQIHFTYSSMHIYPGQMYPTLIKPTATEPDYTKYISHIEECTSPAPMLIKLTATEPNYTK